MTAQVFAHLSGLGREATEMHKVEMKGNPALGVEMLGRKDLKALQAAAFSSEKMIAVVVVNRGAVPVMVSVPVPNGFARGSRTAYLAGEGAQAGGWSTIPKDCKPPWKAPLSPEVGSIKAEQGAYSASLAAHSLTIIDFRK